MDKIYSICEKEVTFEVILQNIFDEYNLVMNLNQYLLIGSTIKAYLSYLVDSNKLIYEFKDNKMLWKKRNGNGATKQNRTADLRVTNPLLYQLSYSGIN